MLTRPLAAILAITLLLAPSMFSPASATSYGTGTNPDCPSDAKTHKMLWNDSAGTPNGSLYYRQLRYLWNGTISAPAKFYDTCPSGHDHEIETGVGGLLLRRDHHAGRIFLAPTTFGEIVWIAGADRDGTLIIGDSPLDCLEGPFVGHGEPLCAGDVNGHIAIFPIAFRPFPFDLLVPPDNSDSNLLDSLNGIELPPLESWEWECDPDDLISICGDGNIRMQPVASDSDGDGIGDWYENVYGALEPFDDLDGDGLLNVDEFRWFTIPIPILFGPDLDNDGWKDGPEATYWNDPSNDAGSGGETAAGRQSTIWSARNSASADPDANISRGDGDGKRNIQDPDSDDDGLLDGAEIAMRSFPEHRDSDCPMTQSATSCEGPGLQRDLSNTSGAGRGDGILDGLEASLWGSAWNADIDGDGIASNLLDPDADGDGLADGYEYFVTLTDIKWFDHDHDRLLDGNDTIVSSSDPRYLIFQDAGVAYVPLEGDTSRRYLGELSNGMNPRDSDTDNDGVIDGEEIEGAQFQPTIGTFEAMYTSADPTNQDLPHRASLATQVLNDPQNVRRVMPGIVDGFLEAPLHDPWTFVTDLVSVGVADVASRATFAPSTERVEEVLSCVDDIVNATPDSVGATVECVVEEIQAVAVGLLPEPLTSTLDDPVPAESELTDLLDIDELEHLPLDLLGRVDLPLTTVLQDPTDLGPMDLPVPPFDPNAPIPLNFIPPFWGGTPFPMLLHDATQFTGDGIYGVVRNVDTLASPVEVIGTLDAGAFNLLYTDLSGQAHVAKNTAIGSTCGISLGTAGCVDPTEPRQFDVTPILVPETDGTQRVRVTITRHTSEPLPILVAPFVQLPNSDVVFALGTDARPGMGGGDTLPASLTISMGSNALQTPIEDSVYAADVQTEPGRPLNVIASLFNVDEAAVPKVPTGEPAHVGLRFAAAPSSSSATVTLRDSGPSVAWEASAVSDPWFGVKRGATVIAASASGFPAWLFTDIHQNADAWWLNHSASGRIGILDIAWNLPGESLGGGARVTDFTSRMTASLDKSLGIASFSSPFEPSGELELVTASGAPEECTRPADVAQWLVTVTTQSGRCVVAKLDGLESLDATWGSSLSVSVQRSNPRDDGLFVGIDQGEGLGITLATTDWPASIAMNYGVVGAAFSASSDLSSAIRKVEFTSLTRDLAGETRKTLLRGEGLPTRITASADHVSGVVRASAELSDRIGDLAFYTALGNVDVGLGENDGVVLVGAPGVMEGAALRLRDFGGAELTLVPTTGLTLTTDTLSTARFEVRRIWGNEFLSASLPRLAKDVDIAYRATPTFANVTYAASEPLASDGFVKVIGSAGTLLVQFDDFPTHINATVDITRATAEVTTSAPIGMLDVAMAGVDGKIETSIVHPNYVMIDQTEEVAQGEFPTARVKTTGLERFNASLTSAWATVHSAFAAGQSGPIGLRYRGLQGWIDANVTSALPPEIRVDISTTNFTWNATEGYIFSTDGAADIPGFEGRWDLRGIPSRMAAEWMTTDGFEATFNHSGALIEKIDIEARLGATEETDFAIKALLLDVPPKLHVKSNSTTGTINASVTDAAGAPAYAGQIQLGYDADGFKVYVRRPDWIQAYASFHNGAVSRVFVNAFGFSSLGVSSKPDPNLGGNRTIHYTANQEAPALVVMSSDDTYMYGTFTALPATFRADLLLEESTDVVSMDFVSSGDGSARYFLELSAPNRVLFSYGNVPTKLHVESFGAILRASATPYADIGVSYNLHNNLLSAKPSGGGHVIVRTGGAGPIFSVSVDGVTSIEIDQIRGHYDIQRTSTTDIYFDVYRAQQNSLYGTVKGLPASLTLDVKEDGAITWTASAATTSADLDVRRGTKWYRLAASGLPSHFEAKFDRIAKTATMSVLDGTAFGDLELGYSGNTVLPAKLVKPGVFLDTTEGDVENGRLSVRMTNLAEVELDWSDGIVVDVARSAGGGEFLAQIRAPDMQADVNLTSLPMTFDATIRTMEAPASVFVDLDGHGHSMEGAWIEYRGAAAEHVAAYFGGIDDQVFIDAHVNAANDLSIEMRVPGAAPWARGQILMNNGHFARFDLTEIPTDFTLNAAKPSTVSFLANSGALTGKFVAAPASISVAIPPGYEGASISTVTGEEHVWLSVTGLERLVFTPNTRPVQDHLSVVFRAAPTKPIVVKFSNATHELDLAIQRPPASMSVHITDGTSTGVQYWASSSADWLKFTAGRKDGAGAGISLLAWPIPETAHALVTKFGDDDFLLKLSGEGAAAKVDLRSDDGLVARGFISGIPATSSARVRASPLLNECSLELESSSPFGLFRMEAGRGDTFNNTWAQAASQYISVDATDPNATRATFLISGLEDAYVCNGLTDGDLTANLTTMGADRLRVYYENATRMLKADITTLPGGFYEFSRLGNVIEYDGPATIGALRIEGIMPMSEIFLGRDAREFVVDATEVPAHIEIEFADGEVKAVTTPGCIGTLFATVTLVAPSGSTGGGGAAGAIDPNFDLDFADFCADHVRIQVSEGAVLHPLAHHKIVFINQAEVQLHVDLTGVNGGVVRLRVLSAKDVHFHLALGLEGGKTLEAIVRLPTPVDIGARIENMPSSLSLTFEYAIAWPASYVLSVTPSQPVGKMVLRVGGAVGRAALTLENLPAGTTGTTGLLGRAGEIRITANPSVIGRMVVDHYVSEGEFSFFDLKEIAGDGLLQYDSDGDSGVASKGRWVLSELATRSGVNAMTRSGGMGMSMRANTLLLPFFVGVMNGASALQQDFFRGGVQENNRAQSVMFLNRWNEYYAPGDVL